MIPIEGKKRKEKQIFYIVRKKTFITNSNPTMQNQAYHLLSA